MKTRTQQREFKQPILSKIKKLKSQNNQEELNKRVSHLEEVVKGLESEVNQLKAEVQELKKENDNSPQFSSYLAEKEKELQSKQSKLEQLKSIINVDNNELKPRSQKPNSDALSTGLVLGVVGIFVVLGLLVILIVSKTKREK